jgi:hypothetical protein
MCLNVFIDIVIEFHHHFLIVMFLPWIPTYIFFFHSIQWLPSYHAIPLSSFFSIPVDPFQLSYNLSLFFTSIHHPTFHIPHSTFYVVTRCAEHSGAQVFYIFSPWGLAPRTSVGLSHGSPPFDLWGGFCPPPTS